MLDRQKEVWYNKYIRKRKGEKRYVGLWN
jgi:hypothetical protein